MENTSYSLTRKEPSNTTKDVSEVSDWEMTTRRRASSVALKDKLAKTNYEEELSQQIQQSPLFLELFNHTLAQIEQQRLNDSELLKKSNEQLRKRIEKLESQNQIFQNQSKDVLTALSAEIREACEKHFKDYYKANFKKEHDKWLAEQSRLQSQLKESLTIQRNIAMFGSGLYVVVAIFFVWDMAYNSFWEWFLTLPEWIWAIAALTAIGVPLLIWYVTIERNKHQ